MCEVDNILEEVQKSLSNGGSLNVDALAAGLLRAQALLESHQEAHDEGSESPQPHPAEAESAAPSQPRASASANPVDITKAPSRSIIYHCVGSGAENVPPAPQPAANNSSRTAVPSAVPAPTACDMGRYDLSTDKSKLLFAVDTLSAELSRQQRRSKALLERCVKPLTQQLTATQKRAVAAEQQCAWLRKQLLGALQLCAGLQACAQSSQSHEATSSAMEACREISRALRCSPSQ